jgi:hypothetical protein
VTQKIGIAQIEAGSVRHSGQIPQCAEFGASDRVEAPQTIRPLTAICGCYARLFSGQRPPTLERLTIMACCLGVAWLDSAASQNA